jgi:hypothetical protein
MINYLIIVVTLLLLAAASFQVDAVTTVTTASDDSDRITDNLFPRMLKGKRRGNPQSGGFLRKGFNKASKGMKEKGKSFRSDDSGLRYQKFVMYENRTKPVATYPMPKELSTELRYYSNAYSVVTREDYEMRGHDVTKYIQKVGGYPARPSSDEYWENFRFVCQVQKLRREGELPSDPKIWTPPDLWKDDDVYIVAEKVRDEYPGANQAALLSSWFANGRRTIQLDYSILPFRCMDDFIGTEVRLAAMLSWAIGGTKV